MPVEERSHSDESEAEYSSSSSQQSVNGHSEGVIPKSKSFNDVGTSNGHQAPHDSPPR